MSTPVTEVKGNYLFDLDGTLAVYDGWKGPEHIGEPIKPMVNRVKKMLAEGKDCRIFTARIFPLEVPVGVTFSEPDKLPADARPAGIASGYIQAWCLEHLGQILPITCRKDYGTVEIWDDRAVGVLLNRGVDRETLVAMHLHRVLTVAGIFVTQGDGFAHGADKACAQIRKIYRAFEDVKALVDGAADALEFAGKVAGINPDLHRARANLTKANGILKAPL